jgi:UDP-N-acetylmuramate--alanine ligase
MNVHFIGIGGIGMSALARLYMERGNVVTGSDATDSYMLQALNDEGMGVFIGHSSMHLDSDVQLVIYSEAIPVDNPELVEARERSIPMKTYFQALGEITSEFRTIAVAGTHGKTTTTGLIARLLMDSYRDPTVVIGSMMKELDGKNMRMGGGELMVVEACEYRRSFLQLNPEIIVLTNIELDHLDYYEDLDDYLDAFRDFVSKLPEDGYLIANGDDENVRKVAESAMCEVLYFSMDSEDLDKLNLSIHGDHNRMNALAAFVVGLTLNIEEEMMVQALNSFEGTWRRFEFKGDYNGAHIYDDYAHHPTEIVAALQGARERYPNRRLVAVFQPHQFSRTKHFLEAFSQAFELADKVVVLDIYGVRDTDEDKKSVSVEDLVNGIKKHHADVIYNGGIEETISFLRKEAQSNDLVLAMGAGNVWKVAEGLTKS